MVFIPGQYLGRVFFCLKCCCISERSEESADLGRDSSVAPIARNSLRMAIQFFAFLSKAKNLWIVTRDSSVVPPGVSIFRFSERSEESAVNDLKLFVPSLCS